MAGRNKPSTVHEQIDRSCGLLSSASRRYVVYALRANGPMTVGELADALVETGVSDARKRAFVSLVHTHLPKLTDCGVIDYEHPEEAVSIEDEGVWQLEPLLSVAERHEIGHGIRSVFDGSSADTVAEPD